MPAPLAIAAFFTIWWISLFVVLPLAARSGEEVEEARRPRASIAARRSRRACCASPSGRRARGGDLRRRRRRRLLDGLEIVPSFRNERRVRHSAAEMFALVADVERYPEFVPLCRRCRCAGASTSAAGVEIADRRHGGRLQGDPRNIHQPRRARSGAAEDSSSNISTGRSAASRTSGISATHPQAAARRSNSSSPTSSAAGCSAP